MNRQQRRQIERETKQETIESNKNREWFKRLPDNKKRYIGYFIEQKVIENDNITAEILDNCFKAAMIEIKDLSLLDCNEIIKIANEHMAEVKNILEKDLKGEYLEMIKDAKLRSEIKEEIKIMVKENRRINNLEIIRALKENYDLPNKDFQILIKESREELGKEALQEIEKDIEKEVNVEVFKDGVKINNGEFVVVSEKEVANPEYVGVDLTIKNKDSNSLVIQYPKNLKIKSMEVEGADGRIYLKSSEGVKLGDKVYKDITDVKHAVEVLESNTSAREDEINKKIEELKKQLEIEKEYKKTELEKYAEIEAVFAM